MSRSCLPFRGVFALLCCLGPVAPPLLAADDVQLAEVVVSTARSATRRLDYAGSIDRLDANQLALVGAQHYADALNRVPGVFIQRGSGQESLIALRSPVLAGAGACGSFLVLEDGVPTRPTGFCNVNELFELNTDQSAAIEVLRGAGPALYGANAMHGIVNVMTAAVADLHPATISLEAGNAGYQRLRFRAATANSLALYGSFSWDGGWRADSATGDVKLNALADYHLAGGLLRLRAAATVLNQETAGFIRGFDSYRDRAVSRSNPNPEAFRDAWSTRLAAHWERDAPNGALNQVSAVLRRSRMEFLQHFLLGKPLERNGQRSAQLSVSHRSASDQRLRWSAGADLEWANGELLESQSGATLEGSAAARAIRPAGRHYDYDVRALSSGAWVSGEFQVAPRLTLGAAVRAEQTRYRYDNRMRSGNTAESGLPCPFGGCLYSRPADRNDRFGNTAPKLQVRYAASSDQSLYAVLARGFRPPETSELYRLQRQQSIAELSSESLDSVELGWIGRRADFRWTVAAWAMRKRNVILRDSNGFNISNGRTRHQGLEYQFAWQLAKHWRIDFAGTQARHRYDFNAAADGGEVISAGRDVDTAPRQLQNLRFSYTKQPHLQAELEIIRVGRYFADAANLAVYPGHTLVNCRISAEIAANWSLSARINNLADTRYADRADFAQGDYRYFPGRGRSAFLQLQWQNN